jgi:hypothetical protein
MTYPRDSAHATESVSGASPCWAVWGAWSTTPYGFATLVKKIHGALGLNARISLTAGLASGPRVYEPYEHPTERELKRFRWLHVVGETADLRLEVEFARRQRKATKLGGRGVVLRVWPLTSGAADRALAVHSRVAADIDDSTVVVGGSIMGKRFARDRSEARLAWLTWRRRLVLGILMLALPLPIFVIPFGVYDGISSPAIQQLVWYCICNPGAWIAACIGSLAVSILLVPGLIPAVRVGGKPVWQKIAPATPTIAGLIIKVVAA